ncbi:hypothetical protein GDI2720 [Gluconacetobacter diazotrophicus PA1 5]|uniref:Uncharacterized protein n=2 Tax=Gluconacetobacter diazotrophicus TaxID=33996 RepID=A9HQ19_GLUDA|nr:hypothetical protein GDI2720 [Gluconacetobacter diazotrophicus PA1 5]
MNHNRLVLFKNFRIGLLAIRWRAKDGTDGFYTSKATATTTADDFRVGSNMAYFNGRVHTGPIRHDLVIGTNG